MVKRIVTKIGDIFCVEIESENKAYFQYIANDMTQLNSSVIRIFKKRYPMDYVFSIEDVVSDDVEFYAHTILKFGIQENCWYKVGNSMDVGNIKDVMFRLYHDEDIVNRVKSYDWYVWKINGKCKDIGELTEYYRKNADLGYVYPYINIIQRIKTGEYGVKELE